MEERNRRQRTSENEVKKLCSELDEVMKTTLIRPMFCCVCLNKKPLSHVIDILVENPAHKAVLSKENANIQIECEFAMYEKDKFLNLMVIIAADGSEPQLSVRKIQIDDKKEVKEIKNRIKAMINTFGQDIKVLWFDNKEYTLEDFYKKMQIWRASEI